MHTPTSTYRLQLTAAFGFVDAQRILPYLRGIGVDWIYLSPILEAAHGSTHGYDVVDPTRISAALGGAEAFEDLARTAHEIGLKVLLDIVPNHLGVQVARENPWWWDVLQHGVDSRHERVFDIDWAAGEGKVLLPIIGDEDMPVQPGAPIGNLTIDTAAGVLRYHDHDFPLSPGTAEGEQPAEDDRTGAEPGVLVGRAAMRVHARQHYRLIHWRQGDFKLNYRRFFTISGLAGVRVEDPEVFDATHVEILRLVREGHVDGLRVDHPDGLRDPRGYLDTLAERTGGVYVVVEKILEPGERLVASWATSGTTGYDALGEIDRVLTDPHGQRPLEEIVASRNTSLDDWATLTHRTKRYVTDGPLQAEVFRITRELTAHGVDHPLIVDAVSELLACFPVYRTYLPDGREYLDEAATRARERRPDLREALDVLLPALADPAHPAAQRFQMTSGMVMAKAVEDRAFYRYSRLTSLNEVGGDPSIFAITPERFHELQRERQANWPHALTALSTHDTKRSEDVRSSITTLSELPEMWEDALRRITAVVPISHPQFENLLWQAVLGAWPATRERLHDYAIKAAREAGDRTSWTMTNAEFEGEIARAVDAAFDDPVISALMQNLRDETWDASASNSLAAKLIQLTMPGVPDVYQGTELWRASLVDPDNRRPVDFRTRKSALQGIFTGVRPPIDDTGAVKLLVTAAALLLRRERPHLFTAYEPLHARGSAAGHALVFDRGGAITIATRLPVSLREGGGWGETRLRLPEGAWVDQLTARTHSGHAPVPMAALLETYPVALLARAE